MRIPPQPLGVYLLALRMGTKGQERNIHILADASAYTILEKLCPLIKSTDTVALSLGYRAIFTGKRGKQARKALARAMPRVRTYRGKIQLWMLLDLLTILKSRTDIIVLTIDRPQEFAEDSVKSMRRSGHRVFIVYPLVYPYPLTVADMAKVWPRFVLDMAETCIKLSAATGGATLVGCTDASNAAEDLAQLAAKRPVSRCLGWLPIILVVALGALALEPIETEVTDFSIRFLEAWQDFWNQIEQFTQ